MIADNKAIDRLNSFLELACEASPIAISSYARLHCDVSRTSYTVSKDNASKKLKNTMAIHFNNYYKTFQQSWMLSWMTVVGKIHTMMLRPSLLEDVVKYKLPTLGMA